MILCQLQYVKYSSYRDKTIPFSRPHYTAILLLLDNVIMTLSY
jgi:hypothetical protein